MQHRLWCNDHLKQRFGIIFHNRVWISKKIWFLFSMKATSAMWLDVLVRFQWKCKRMRLRCLWKLTLLRTTLKFKTDENTNDLYDRCLFENYWSVITSKSRFWPMLLHYSMTYASKWPFTFNQDRILSKSDIVEMHGHNPKPDNIQLFRISFYFRHGWNVHSNDIDELGFSNRQYNCWWYKYLYFLDKNLYNAHYHRRKGPQAWNWNFHRFLDQKKFWSDLDRFLENFLLLVDHEKCIC